MECSLFFGLCHTMAALEAARAIGPELGCHIGLAEETARHGRIADVVPYLTADYQAK